MDVLDRLSKAKDSVERAMIEYRSGELRKALGSIDYVEDRMKAAKYILIEEIKELE